MHQTDMPMDYHVWGAILECYQKYTPKPTNIADLKDRATSAEILIFFPGDCYLSAHPVK